MYFSSLDWAESVGGVGVGAGILFSGGGLGTAGEGGGGNLADSSLIISAGSVLAEVSVLRVLRGSWSSGLL